MTTDPGRVNRAFRKRTWLLLSFGAVILVAVVWSFSSVGTGPRCWNRRRYPSRTDTTTS